MGLNQLAEVGESLPHVAACTIFVFFGNIDYVAEKTKIVQNVR